MKEFWIKQSESNNVVELSSGKVPSHSAKINKKAEIITDDFLFGKYHWV